MRLQSFDMRSAKNNNFQSLGQLISALNDLSRYDSTQIQNIVSAAYSSHHDDGLIIPRINTYYNKNPVLWAEELASVTRCLTPEGQLFTSHSGLLNTCDYPTSIDSNILPESVLKEMSGSHQRKSNLLRGLKKQLGEKYFISNWQWYWCHLCYSLVNHTQPVDSRSYKEEQEEDQYFHSLSRNPFLIILQRSLTHNYKKEPLLERLRAVVQLYTVEQLLYSTKKSESKSRFQLKNQHILAMFLLIQSHRTKIHSETIAKYQEFFMKVTENYNSLQHSHLTLSYVIRGWLHLVNREHSLDNNLIQQLDNANPIDGWYRLQRVPSKEWEQQIRKCTFSSMEIPSIITTRKNIYRLLSKTQWLPSFSLLSALEQFIIFDYEVFSPHLRNTLEREEINAHNKAIERILVKLAQSGAPIASLQKRQEHINQRLGSVLNNTLSINFVEKCDVARQNLSHTNRNLSKSVSYQSARIRNVWEHPLQQNEYYILFRGALWVSQQIDQLLPGHKHRAYPLLNIRILANPFIFFILLIFLSLWVRSLFT